MILTIGNCWIFIRYIFTALLPHLPPADVASCVGHAIVGNTADGIYTIKPGGTFHDVYCDQTTDGGGWMLAYSYARDGGVNDALLAGTIPTDPTGVLAVRTEINPV